MQVICKVIHQHYSWVSAVGIKVYTCTCYVQSAMVTTILHPRSRSVILSYQI